MQTTRVLFEGGNSFIVTETPEEVAIEIARARREPHSPLSCWALLTRYPSGYRGSAVADPEGVVGMIAEEHGHD